MSFGLIAYPQKPLIIPDSGVSRGTRSPKVVLFGVFFNLHTIPPSKLKIAVFFCSIYKKTISFSAIVF